MAKRGTGKRWSQIHEGYIADLFDGRRSPSSGAAVTDPGDVCCEYLLIECKTEIPKLEIKPLPAWVQQFDKIAGEAWENDLEPMLALRFYQPGHRLAGSDGFIDLSVRLARDDAEREQAYSDFQQK